MIVTRSIRRTSWAAELNQLAALGTAAETAVSSGMRHRQVFLAALLLVACDGGNEHGGGQHGADGSREVFLGRGPAQAQPTAIVVAANPESANAGGSGPDAKAAPAPTPEPEPAVEEPGADAPADQPADAPAGEGDSPEAEAEADAPAPEAETPEAPAAGEHTEAEWVKLAKVRLGNPKVDGALDPDAVRKAVRSNSKDLRSCYAQGLIKAPELTGKLTLEFVVDKKGKIDSSKVKSSTLGDASVEACVTEEIGGWKFEAPEDGKKVKVKLPLTLGL